MEPMRDRTETHFVNFICHILIIALGKMHVLQNYLTNSYIQLFDNIKNLYFIYRFVVINFFFFGLKLLL